MAPPNWATKEQLKFLHRYAPIFVEHTANETQSKFWPRLSEDWFSRWPELNVLIKDQKLPPQASTANPNAPDDADAMNARHKLTNEEQELYGAAIRMRKEKLRNWMRNNARKVAGASKCLHQEEEVYHHLYKEKLAKAALTEWLPELWNSPNGSDGENESDSNGNGNVLSKRKPGAETSSVKSIRALRMKVRREVHADAWANETEDVCWEVREAMRCEREEVTEFKDEEGKPEFDKIFSIITNLMSVLKDTCEEIYHLLGWSTIVLTGGPNPALKNKISLQIITFGKMAAGNSFNESYPGFQNNIVQPYVAWLKNVYADPLQFSVPKAPVDVSDETTGAEDFDKQPADSIEDKNPFNQLPND